MGVTHPTIVDDSGPGFDGTVWNDAWETAHDAAINAAIAVVPTTLTNHGVVIGQAGAAVVATSAGTAGQVLTSNGASADPTFQGAVDVGVCEGRLTLTTAVPVTTADVTGATNVFFAPYKGSRIALYDGTNWQIYTFTEKTLALGTLVNAQAYDVFAFLSAGVVTLELLEWANATVTMTIAAPGVVTWTAHGMSTGNSITFTNSGGALPTGVTANTQYWITVVDANSFKLSTSLANVSAATFITTSGTQSGTHTGRGPHNRATQLTTQDGVPSKVGALTRRYLGTFMTTSTTTTEDSLTKRLLWNYYNRIQKAMRVIETTDTWTYTLATFRQANASAANQLAVMIGAPESSISLQVRSRASNSGAVAVNVPVAIGEDSTNTPAAGCLMDSPNAGHVANCAIATGAQLDKFPPLGYHAYTWLEFSTASNVTTWAGDGGVAFIQCGMTGRHEC